MLEEQEASTGLQHTPHFTERTGGIRDGAQGPGCDHRVDALVFNRNGRCRSLDEGHWKGLAFSGLTWWIIASVLLGIGTAIVYPTLLAAISDVVHPTWRARSLSIYRFWRDLGYAIGALLASFIGEAFGLAWAIGSIGVLTFLSGTVVAVAMRERNVEG